MTTIEELMDFISSQIYPYFYGVDNGYEVMYNKEDSQWRVRPRLEYSSRDLGNGNLKDEHDWRYFKVEEAVAVFEELNIDVHRLYVLMVGAVESKGVYYKMQLDRIAEMLGTDAVDKAEAAWKELTNGIHKHIRKTRIALVDNED